MVYKILYCHSNFTYHESFKIDIKTRSSIKIDFQDLIIRVVDTSKTNDRGLKNKYIWLIAWHQVYDVPILSSYIVKGQGFDLCLG